MSAMETKASTGRVAANLPEKLILVSSADDRYAMPLAVMLSSAVCNLSAAVGLHIFILDGGLSLRNKQRIRRSIPERPLDLTFLQPSAQTLKGVPVFGHVSLSTYFRLLMPALLPPELDKAVYVDADCVVVGDLAEMWSKEMGDCPLMAVPAIAPGRVGVDQVEAAARRAAYLGAGVLLVNLKCWRDENLGPKIITYLVDNSDAVEHWDQDGINHVLKDRWQRLDVKWNYRVDCGVPSLEGRDTPEDLQDNAVIVHYASSAKPWDYGVTHPSAAIFDEYLNKTAWQGWRPRVPWGVLRNRHFWGAQLRRLPVLGPIWQRLRS